MTPPDILALGLTCSDLHYRCRSLLEQHQDAYNKYTITSDLSPETAVDLLRDTPTADVNKYHVRELEFWALSGNYQLAEEESLRSAFDAREVQRYVQKGFDWWNLTEQEIEDAEDSLEEGHEAWLKLLLISLCPRLHSIRFVKRKGDLYCMLAWIGEAIERSICCEWPPGFESSRSISVGVSMGQLPHEEEDEEYCGEFGEFTKPFHIPNLKNIYFSGLSCEEFFWDEHIWDEELLPNGTSKVESLFLDSVQGGWDEFYLWLSCASKQLDTVVLRATDSRRGGLNDLSSLVDSLAETNKMERLVLYHPAAMQNQLYTIGIYDHQSIKQITMAALDMGYCFDHTASDRTFGDSDIALAFPPNIEALYIWGQLNSPRKRRQWSLKHFDLYLTELIESGFYKHLKVVYVEHVERTLLKSVTPLNIAEWKNHAFRKATAVGHKAGVHICTLMNRDDGGYWKNFPARFDRFDIKTGPFAAERPEEWKLNLYTGQWEPNCSGCGECEECLALYPSELWKENAAQRSNSS